MTRLPLSLAALLILTACQAPPRSRTEAATTAACRTEVDRVYAAQNRADLSRRDQRDSPFASSYLPGITTRELGARYARDNMVSSCISNSAQPSSPAPDTGTGPTFSPVSR